MNKIVLSSMPLSFHLLSQSVPAVGQITGIGGNVRGDSFHHNFRSNGRVFGAQFDSIFFPGPHPNHSFFDDGGIGLQMTAWVGDNLFSSFCSDLRNILTFAVFVK